MKRSLENPGRNTGHTFIKKARKAVLSTLLAFLMVVTVFGANGLTAYAAGEPTALPATAVAYNAFTANWNAVGGTTHYYLDVATDSGFINKVVDNQDMGTATTYALSSLSTVTNYFYRVKAGSSGYSNVAFVQTPAKDGAFSSSSAATSGNEYSISTAAQLKELADKVKAGTKYDGVSLKLAENIDLAGYSSGSGWEPIGVRISGTNYPFQGKFDGNGYVVKNMYINRASSEAIGLFGVIDGATVEIKNVGVVDCDVTGGSRVGAIVGWALGSGNVTISECFTTGRVSSTRYVGGIAGEAETPSFTVKNCYSAATIVGSRNDYNTDEGDAGFGGIVGYVFLPGAKTTNIINCYSTGAIQGPNCVGGIVGGIEIRQTSGMSVTVRNCAALNKSITATFATGTEEADGLHTGLKDTLRTVSMENRVVGGIWENTISGTPTYTKTLNNLYALDTTSVMYHTTTPVSAKTPSATSVDGASVTATNLENNAHNWTNGTVSDPGGTIPAGSVTYFDYSDAGSASSVWYYYQDRQVLPVLHRYIDNYQPVLIKPDILSDTVPYATEVYANSTSATLETGNTLTADYTYNANSAGSESGSTYKWYRYDTEKGGTGALISGASSKTYALSASDAGKFVSFEVTPKSSLKTGSAVESGRVGAVTATPTTAAAADNVLSANPTKVAAGSAITLTATGARQGEAGVTIGDERYIPKAWSSAETGKTGTFSASGGVYTSAYTPTVPGTYTVTATFQKQTYDGSAWADAAGSTDTKTASVTVEPKVTLTPDGTGSGHTVAPTSVVIGLYDADGNLMKNQNFKLFLDGSQVGGVQNTGSNGQFNYSVPSGLAPGDHTLKVETTGGTVVKTVTFSIPCNITYNAGLHGTLTGGTSEAVLLGLSPAAVPDVTASHGYVFAGWSSDNGVTLLSKTQLAAAKMTGHTTYTAYYTELPKYTVTYKAGAHGTITGSASETVIQGDKIAAVPDIEPDKGYSFKGWSTNSGKTILKKSQVQGIVVTGNVTYTAYYVNQEENPDTGDYSHTTLIIITAFMGLVLVALVAFYIKVRQRIKHQS